MSTSSNRFTQAGPDNQQPALWVLTSLFMTWCVLGLVARVFIRRKTWLLADTAHAVACAIAVASWAAMYAALNNGAGLSPSMANDYSAAGKATFASIVFLILAKGVATVSHLLLLKHMLAIPFYVKLCTIMTSICLILYLAACLTVSVGCSPSHALSTKEESCRMGTARWSVAVTMLYSQAFVATILPAIAFWQIQKPVKIRLNIMAWFSVPPFIDIIPLSLTIWRYTTSINSNPSGTGLVGFVVCLQSSLCWNLLYPVIPALRPTALSYATRGVALTPDGTAMGGSHSYSKGGSHGYGKGGSNVYSNNMSKSGNGRGYHSKKLDIDEMPLRPISSREGNHTSIGAGSNHDEGDVDSTRGMPNTRTIQVTQEFEIVER